MNDEKQLYGTVQMPDKRIRNGIFLWYEKGTGVYLCFQSFSATVGLNRTDD